MLDIYKNTVNISKLPIACLKQANGRSRDMNTGNSKTTS